MTSVVRQAVAVAVAARVPVILWGGPGVGKTSAVQEMAVRSGWPCEVVIASIREPSDFAGLPIVSDQVTTVRLAPPRWAERLEGEAKGILFLDELSTAPPAVQAALLRVVLERTVGDLRLPDGIAVVAAANRPDQAADGWDLSAPLANRFCHLEWTIDAAEWSDGVLGGFQQPAIPEAAPETVRHLVARHLAAIGAFVRSRPHLLHAVPTTTEDAGRAWPSPRSWRTAAELLATCEAVGGSMVVAASLVIGCVGPGAASEFLAWREDLQLPDPEAVLANPTQFVLPERGDRAYAALSSVTAAVVTTNTSVRWEAAWRAIAAATRDRHGDIAVAAVRTLIQNRPPDGVPPPEVLQQMAPLLREAGMFDRLA